MKSYAALKDSLKTFDFFGISYQFNVNGSSEFKSPLGGLLFLIFCFPVCYFMLTLTIITFRRQKYVLNIHNEISRTLPNVPINQNSNFEVGFNFKSTSPQFDPSDFSLSLFYREITKGYGMEEGKITNIGFEKCPPTIFAGVEDPNNDFELCPTASRTHLLVLKGSMYDHKFSSIAINISVAENKTLGELKQKYRGHKIFFNYFSSDKEVRYLQTEDILKNSVSTLQFVIDFSITKRAVMYVKNTQCTFENSILLTDIENKEFSSYDFYDTFHNIKLDETDKTLYEIDLGLVKKTRMISRSFYKVEELLSDAGGIFSNLIFFFYLVMTVFNQKQCDLTILNRVFQFNNTAKNNQNIVLLKNKLDENVEEVRLNIEKDDKKYISPAFTGSILFSAFCCCFLSRKSKKMYSLYAKGESYLNHYLNVVTYLNKMQQISLIKDVIMSDDQKIVFNFLSKPHISDYSSKKVNEEIIKFSPEALNKEELESLMKALNNLKENLSEADNRLIAMVNSKVDFIFKDLLK